MKRLRFVEFSMETVTPLLSQGAEAEPEVRPPTFRGIMRYWLRALLNGFVAGDLKKLCSLESMVFGSTSLASPVAVRIRGDFNAEPLPPEPPAGLHYLLWSAYAQRLEMIKPGERFVLRLQEYPLQLRPFTGEGKEFTADFIFSLACASLWLLARLGSVGLRARRGAGCLMVLNHPAGWPEELPSPVSRAETPQALAEELAQGLTSLRSWVGLPSPDELPTPVELSTLHPQTCQIYVLDATFPSWQDAMSRIGEAFRSFRLRYESDYSLIRSILTGGKALAQCVQRAIFGLPLNFFFSSIYKQELQKGLSPRDARRKASARVVPSQGQRRASPLFIRFTRLADEAGSYVSLFILFRSRFLPVETLQIRPADRSLPPLTVAAPSDYSLIEDWFSYLEREIAPLIPVNFK